MATAQEPAQAAAAAATQPPPSAVSDSSPHSQQRDQQRDRRPKGRSSSLLKYKRVEKARDTAPEDEIRVMGSGRVPRYVNYAAKLFGEMEKTSVTIRATGKAVAIAVSVGEVVKRRFKGLHQVTTIGWTEITDEYEPLEAGLEKRIEKRTVASISLFLTTDESKVDKKAPGYQEPIDESLIIDDDQEFIVGQRFNRRNNRRGGRGGPRRGPGGGREGGTDEPGTNDEAAQPRRDARRGRGRRNRPRGGPKRDGGEGNNNVDHQAAAAPAGGPAAPIKATDAPPAAAAAPAAAKETTA